jgi:hypothetical protein
MLARASVAEIDRPERLARSAQSTQPSAEATLVWARPNLYFGYFGRSFQYSPK